jgi:hypothetical protein
MNPDWKKKMNAIPKQTKGPNDRITAQEWNQIINILSEQANNNAIGSEKVIKLVNQIESGELDRELVFKIIKGYEGDIEKVVEDLIRKLDLIINIRRVELETDLPVVGSEKSLYIVKFRRDLNEDGEEVLRPFNAVFAFDYDNGYYQIDGEKGGVLQYHNEEMFPILGNDANLYLAKYKRNDEDTDWEDYNMVFRYDAELSSYVPVAGQGAGGGVTSTMRVIPLYLNGKINFKHVIGRELIYTYGFTHSTLSPASVEFSRGGQVFKRETIMPGDHEINLTNQVVGGTNLFEIKITDYDGISRILRLSITGIAINISSFFVDTYIHTGDIIFDYKVDVSEGQRKAFFKINNGSVIEESITQTNNIKVFSGLSHGSHLLEFWAEVTIEGETVISDSLYFTLIQNNPNSAVTIIASKFVQTKTTLGSLLLVDYLVFSNVHPLIETNFLIDGEIVRTLSVDSTKKYWAVKNLSLGNHFLLIQAGGTTINFTIEVEQMEDLLIENVDDSFLQLYLDANSSAEEDTNWLNSGLNGESYTFNMEGFNFKTNGWLDNGLVFNGFAKATLQFRPFATEVGITGRTIEIEFKTDEVANNDLAVVSCMSNGKGFEIFPDKMTFKGSNNRVDVLYREDTKIKISIVINKQTNNIITYINGVASGLDRITSETSFLQPSGGVPIKINEFFSGCTIYSMRFYNRALNDKEILSNYMYDLLDPQEKAEHFYGSKVVDVNGYADFEQIKNKIPVFVVTLNNRNLPVDREDRPDVEEIEYIDPFNPTQSFKRSVVKIRTQGSSSQLYPRKNFRLYNKALEKNPVQLSPNSVPSYRINLKTDYIDSSTATNDAISRIVQSIYNEKTPPQTIVPGIRSIIHTQLCILFHKKNGQYIFQGLYSMNNDKSDERVFGHRRSLGFLQSHRYEVLFNASNHAVAFVRKPELTDEQWYAECVEGFESRHPEITPEDARPQDYYVLMEMVEWISSRNLEDADPIIKAQKIATFKTELNRRFSNEYLTKYALILMTFGLIDNFGKDLLLSTWYDPDARIPNFPRRKTPTYETKPRKVKLRGIFRDIPGGLTALEQLPTLSTLPYLAPEEEWEVPGDEEYNSDLTHAYLCNGMIYVFTGNNTSTSFYGQTFPAVKGFQNMGYAKWYATLYDLDTAVGIDNAGKFLDEEGNLRYEYDIELEDEYVYAQAESKLWDLVLNYCMDDIREYYRQLRFTLFSEESIRYYFYDTHIRLISKMLYNLSHRFKYIENQPNMPDVSYYGYMLRGDRWEQIQRWMNLRLAFLDSKFNANIEQTKIGGRFNVTQGVPLTFSVISSIHQWITVSFGNPVEIVQQVRTKAGEVKNISFTRDAGMNLFESYVYHGQYISEITNLKDLVVRELYLSNATRLRKLDLEGSTIEDIQFGNNRLLEEINIKDTIYLNKAMDISQLIRLRKFNASGSVITGLTLPEGGILSELILPQTIKNLTLRNQLYLNDLTFSIEGEPDIDYLRIENTNAINSIALLNNIGTPLYLRITGLKISMYGIQHLLDIAEKLYDFANDTYKIGGIDSNGNTIPIGIFEGLPRGAVITGTVKVLTTQAISEQDINKLDSIVFNYMNLSINQVPEGITMGEQGDYLTLISYTGNATEFYVPSEYNAEITAENSFVPSVDGWKEVKYISPFAFNGKTAITLLNIPRSIVSIGQQAFNGMTNLGTIFIPSTVETMGLEVFRQTPKALILCEAASKPEGWNVNWYANQAITILWGVPSQNSTFSFNSMGGNYVPNIINNVLLQAPTAPTQLGKDFVKWQLNGEDISYPFVPSVAGNYTFTAVWEDATFTVQYLKPNGSNWDIHATHTIKYGEYLGVDFEAVTTPVVGTLMFRSWNVYSVNGVKATSGYYVEHNHITHPDGSVIKIYAMMVDTGGLGIVYDSVEQVYNIVSYSPPANHNLFVPATWDDGQNGLHLIKNVNLVVSGSLGERVLSIEVEDGVFGRFHKSASFNNCSINILPDTITSLGDYVFAKDMRSEINIPTNVTGSIGRDLFNGCTNLVSAYIHDGITDLGSQSAFNSCVNLEYVYISKDITTFTSFAFSNCNKLKEVTFGRENITISIAQSYFRPLCETLSGEIGPWNNKRSIRLNTELKIFFTKPQNHLEVHNNNKTVVGKNGALYFNAHWTHDEETDEFLTLHDILPTTPYNITRLENSVLSSLKVKHLFIDRTYNVGSNITFWSSEIEKIHYGGTCTANLFLHRAWNLKELILNEGMSTLRAQQNNAIIEEIIIPSTVTTASSMHLWSWSNLKRLVFKRTTPVTMDNLFVSAEHPDCLFYVPWSEDGSILTAYSQVTGFAGNQSRINKLRELNPDGSIPT